MVGAGLYHLVSAALSPRASSLSRGALPRFAAAGPLARRRGAGCRIPAGSGFAARLCGRRGGAAMTPEMVAQARALTPGCTAHAHLNNAGAALMPTPVLEAQIEHLRLEAALGGYEAAHAAADRVARPRHALAKLLHGHADDMVLCDSATSAWRIGLEALDLASGQEVLISRTVYASNFMTLRRLVERRGVRLRVVESDPTGQLSLAGLRAAIGPHTRLIAMAHMPTNSGLVNPVAEVGAIAQAAGVPFLLDACQTVGQLEIDVREIGCDLLSGT
ncbi:MAG TPA: aminotransferase class V-fold PLP-dependent enzyme, partial [Nannocystis exedens]|nr:aminotransferase class V-fold PLP-dependent enzyme [Nannocystis exedens]